MTRDFYNLHNTISITLFWDLPIQAPFELFRVGLTVSAWVVIIYFINLGLKQIDDAKKLEKDQVKK